MTYKELIRYFGSTHKAARAIGMSVTGVWHWRNKKQIPLDRQERFELITGGALKAAKQ